MKHLIIDIETNGMWGQVIEFASILIEKKSILSTNHFYLKNGFKLSKDVVDNLWIDRETLLKKGIPYDDGMDMIYNLLKQTDLVVMHGADYILNAISPYDRIIAEGEYKKYNVVCTFSDMDELGLVAEPLSEIEITMEQEKIEKMFSLFKEEIPNNLNNSLVFSTIKLFNYYKRCLKVKEFKELVKERSRNPNLISVLKIEG